MKTLKFQKTKIIIYNIKERQQFHAESSYHLYEKGRESKKDLETLANRRTRYKTSTSIGSATFHKFVPGGLDSILQRASYSDCFSP